MSENNGAVAKPVQSWCHWLRVLLVLLLVGLIVLFVVQEYNAQELLKYCQGLEKARKYDVAVLSYRVLIEKYPMSFAVLSAREGISKVGSDIRKSFDERLVESRQVEESRGSNYNRETGKFRARVRLVSPQTEPDIDIEPDIEPDVEPISHERFMETFLERYIGKWGNPYSYYSFPIVVCSICSAVLFLLFLLRLGTWRFSFWMLLLGALVGAFAGVQFEGVPKELNLLFTESPGLLYILSCFVAVIVGSILLAVDLTRKKTQ